MANPKLATGGAQDSGLVLDARSFGLTLLPSAPSLLMHHAPELPQKDELCGAFWGKLVLRAAGFLHTVDGEHPIDQDAVAAAAGTTISRMPDPGFLPPGEQSRRDYRLTLPFAADPLRSGTAAPGLARAVAELSGGALQAVPVAGPWDARSLGTVVDMGRDDAVLGLVANLATTPLWSSRPEPAVLVRHLATGTLDGPQSEWSVGHFVAVLGVVEGPAGALLLLADTYRSLGWSGIHAQPLELVATALRREGLDHGGVLVIVRTDEAEAIAARLQGAGLDVSHWDNGSDDVAGR